MNYNYILINDILIKNIIRDTLQVTEYPDLRCDAISKR